MRNNYTIDTQELENLAISPDILRLGDVANIKQIGEKIVVNLNFYNQNLAEDIEAIISSRYPSIKTEVIERTESQKAQNNIKTQSNINNIIAITSNKDKAGKSLISINLALALVSSGAKVGILEADPNKSSIDKMLGIDTKKQESNNKIIPNFTHGIEVISTNNLSTKPKILINEEQVFINSIQYLLDNTIWGKNFNQNNNTKSYLDYLFIDLPQVTHKSIFAISKTIPITGAVTITTPQDIILENNSDSLNLFNEIQIDNIGIIENMNIPTENNEVNKYLKYTSDENQLLGKIPFDENIQHNIYNGQPIYNKDSNYLIPEIYEDISQQIAINIAKKDKEVVHLFGKINIE